MPDISMCSNEECPLRETCYRAQAKPDSYQSFSEFEYNEETESCEYYCPIGQGDD